MTDPVVGEQVWTRVQGHRGLPDGDIPGRVLRQVNRGHNKGRYEVQVRNRILVLSKESLRTLGGSHDAKEKCGKSTVQSVPVAP